MSCGKKDTTTHTAHLQGPNPHPLQINIPFLRLDTHPPTKELVFIYNLNVFVINPNVFGLGITARNPVTLNM